MNYFGAFCAFLVLNLFLVTVFSYRPFRISKLYRNYALKNAESSTEEIVEEAVLILTPKARSHLKTLKKDQNGDLFVRMGVKSGGCSGMSYVMDLIEQSAITDEDHIEAFDDIKCVVDPKSLLYLYGLKLDYSDELIGGGFKFSNPNAESSW